MRVFISSVRRGLEEERDALPGLITAIGHTPIRFEDFGATDLPSREACLAGVGNAELYLLILGPNYGHRFLDTHQSPTHDEWAAATAAGIPRLVYRKDGVQFEKDQEEFIQAIGNYTSGVFYDTFSSTADLLTKVAEAVRNAASAPVGLRYTPLDTHVPIVWRRTDPSHTPSSERPTLEVHVQNVDTRRFSARELKELADTLLTRLRNSGVVDHEQGLSVERNDGSVAVAIAGSVPSNWNTVRKSVVTGVRVLSSGQVSVWSELPSDGLGAVLDDEALTSQIASALQLIGELRVVVGPELAIAVSVDPMTSVSIGSVNEMPRRSANFGFHSSTPVRVNPDESTTLAALDSGSSEVARNLGRELIEQVRRR